ncbi:MAG: HAD family hydrolase [Caldilineaceae bacterium]|nr:HAD family hydrolase [Caldilineaceae bacterium]
MNVLFDLDGTLHDKVASLHRCGQTLFDMFLADSNIDHTHFVTAFVPENSIIQPKTKVFDKLGETFALSSKVTVAMGQRFDDTFHEFAQRFAFALEALDLLQRQGVRIGCVTNGRDFFQRNKIKALELEPYFDVIVTSGAMDVKKPDPKLFYHALAALQASAADTVFIGDSLTADMQPAKALGMTTVWKTDGTVEQPSYVDHCLQTFANFPVLWARIRGTV